MFSPIMKLVHESKSTIEKQMESKQLKAENVALKRRVADLERSTLDLGAAFDALQEHANAMRKLMLELHAELSAKQVMLQARVQLLERGFGVDFKMYQYGTKIQDM